MHNLPPKIDLHSFCFPNQIIFWDARSHRDFSVACIPALRKLLNIRLETRRKRRQIIRGAIFSLFALVFIARSSSWSMVTCSTNGSFFGFKKYLNDHIERLNQSHLYPNLEVPELICPVWESNPGRRRTRAC
jgi:hypothetical protein